MFVRSRTTSIVLAGFVPVVLSACTPAANAPSAPQSVGRSVCDCFENVGDRIFFTFDSATLQESSHETLFKQANWLIKYPNFTITIQGYADERGTREYNLALGMKRAEAMRRALVSLGVAQKRIKVVSYGKDRPAIIGSNEAAWAQNRRAVAVIDESPSR